MGGNDPRGVGILDPKDTNGSIYVGYQLTLLRWRSGAVVRASDFGPRGPWFEPRPVHISLWH